MEKNSEEVRKTLSNSGIVEDILECIKNEIVNNAFLPVKKNQYEIMFGKSPEGLELYEIKNDAIDSYNNYFFYGHCNVFAQILAEVFEEYLDEVLTASKDIHVVVKICGHYYDVRGLIDTKEEIDSYNIRSKEEIEPYQSLAQTLKDLAIGNYSEDFDGELIKYGISAGKKRLNEYIKVPVKDEKALS